MHIRHPTDATRSQLVRAQAADILELIFRSPSLSGYHSDGRALVSSLTEQHSKRPISSNKLNPGLLQRPLHGEDGGTRDVAARFFKIDNG